MKTSIFLVQLAMTPVLVHIFLILYKENAQLANIIVKNVLIYQTAKDAVMDISQHQIVIAKEIIF